LQCNEMLQNRNTRFWLCAFADVCTRQITG
jgi:hypothetical protein